MFDKFWYSSKLIKTAKNLMFVRGNLLLLLRNNYGSTIYYVAVQCTISGDTLWDMTRGVSFAMKVRIFSAASVSWLIVHLEFWNGWEELHFQISTNYVDVHFMLFEKIMCNFWDPCYKCQIFAYACNVTTTSTFFLFPNWQTTLVRTCGINFLDCLIRMAIFWVAY